MRRRVVIAGAAAVLTGGAWGLSERRSSPPPLRPSAPPGDERVEQRVSAARGGRTVDFYTAVPAGHGTGRGLPVCLVLHGATARPRDYAGFGLGGFLTEAVRRGAPPFVLAGATGDRLAWEPQPGDDPRRMVTEEIPAWCAERGFDVSRPAVWGWSMGGYGALTLAATRPGVLSAVAAFSPAVSPGDAAFAAAPRLAGTPVGLWCGDDDPLAPAVRAFAEALPSPPAAGGYGPGGHSFAYWSTLLPSAFPFISANLARTR